MTAKFKICCNCGAKAKRTKRLCNNPKGCGPTSAFDRRAGLKSVWREPTAAEVAEHQAHNDRMTALLNELLQS
jgi:hypothetical protein